MRLFRPVFGESPTSPGHPLTSTIVFLTAKRFQNNPMLRLYRMAFEGVNEVVISCNDHLDQSPDSAGTFVPAPKFYWGYFQKLFSTRSGRSDSGMVDAMIKSFCAACFVLDYAWANLRQLIRVYPAVKGKRVCHVVAVDGDLLLAAYLLSRLTRAKFVYSVYEIWPDQIAVATRLQAAARWVMVRIEALYCHRTDRILTVSKTWTRYIRRRYGLSPDKFFEVAVCPDVVQTKAEDLNTRSVLKLHYHGVFMLSRGLDELIKSFDGLRGAELYLRGFGPDEASLREMVDQLSLTDRVFFLPPVPLTELVVSGRDYDVGIILAKRDTANGRMCTGFKCFEYLNSGLMLLAPSSWPLRDFLRENPCGTTYGWPDADALRQRIEFLIKNVSGVMAMKAASRMAAKEFNSVEQARVLRAAFDA